MLFKQIHPRCISCNVWIDLYIYTSSVSLNGISIVPVLIFVNYSLFSNPKAESVCRFSTIEVSIGSLLLVPIIINCLKVMNYLCFVNNFNLCTLTGIFHYTAITTLSIFFISLAKCQTVWHLRCSMVTTLKSGLKYLLSMFC